MRLELPDDQWADLRDQLTYGQAREVRRAYARIQDDAGNMADVDYALVRAYVVEWHVKDYAGELMALEDLERAPDAPVQLIAREASRIWNGKPSPKPKPKGASDTTSSSSLRALA